MGSWLIMDYKMCLVKRKEKGSKREFCKKDRSESNYIKEMKYTEFIIDW